MNSTTLTVNPMSAVTTSYGGENTFGFRVLRTVACSDSAKGKKKLPRTLAGANEWLNANAAKVDAHAKASTQRLIRRDSV